VQLIAAILVAWYNLDFLTEVSFTIKNAERKTEVSITTPDEQKIGVPQLALGDIILPPASKSLPSFVVFEIKCLSGNILNRLNHL
jgi:hypothetical protein